MGWLSTPARIIKPNISRLVFLCVGAVAFVVTEFGRFVLRPHVRQHAINDFGLTDVIGNLGGIVVMIFLGSAVMNPTRVQSYRLAAFYSVGFVIYEFLQPVLPKGVFDWMDVVGTVFGYLFSVLVLIVLWRLTGDPADRTGEA